MREAHATAGAAGALVCESKLTTDEAMHLERLREEATWSEDEALYLERLRADMLLHKLQQTEETSQSERALARRLFTLELQGDAATAAVPAANATLRGLHLEARERRASEGGVEPRRSGNSAAPSGSGSVVTLANLRVSEEQEDRCAICDGKGVSGVNELVRCGFGDGCCIQELGDAPRRACWHAACAPKLCGKQGQHVVCARHEKDARFKLDVGASSRQA